LSRPSRLLPLLALLSACSPVYVARSAAGHAGLLWRRRSIAKTAADPSTPPELKAKLELALEVREYAFKSLALTRSHAYETWTPVKGDALTWLVSASDRTKLNPYQFHFPLIGSFPYKGHFRRDLADAEAASLEKKGYDATVSGAGAYKTPLPIADPLPSTVLDAGEGGLAETLIHELTHGTVYFKNQTDFDEALATWLGARGAEIFLREKFGPDSPQLKAWRDGAARYAKRERMYADLREKLTTMYDGPGTDAEKLEQRRAVFEWARAEAKSRGLAPLREPLNNAVVLAHALYSPDFGPFDALFDKCGHDWPRTIAALKSLDHHDPFAALKSASR
jgi:predicted aminopeptidase